MKLMASEVLGLAAIACVFLAIVWAILFVEWPVRLQPPPSIKVEKSDRVQVSQIGIFSDDLAYDHKRGIYLIHDSETGKEYLGVSGIGISEIGSHSQWVGKVSETVEDER